MNTLQGELGVGEGSGSASRIRWRQAGPPWYWLALVVIPVFGVAGDILGESSVSVAGTSAGAYGGLVGLAIGYFTWMFFYRRIAVKLFRRRFKRRGQPLVLPIRLEVRDDALIYDLGGVHQTIDWSCVTDLFPTKGYWVFLAQASPVFAPVRLFADAEAERSFVAAGLDRMTPAARQRSSKAVALAGGNVRPGR